MAYQVVIKVIIMGSSDGSFVIFQVEVGLTQAQAIANCLSGLPLTVSVNRDFSLDPINGPKFSALTTGGNNDFNT